jgi:opacity protein-like surface antigen
MHAGFYKFFFPFMYVMAPVLIVVTPSTVKAAEWSYEVSPYIWTAGIDGEIGAPGMTTSVEVGFEDYIDLVDAGLAFSIDARSDGNWSWQADVMWMKLSEGMELPPTTLDLDVEQLLLEATVGYQPDGWREVEIVGGVRYTDMDTTIDFAGMLDLQVGDSFIDPLIGIRWRPQYNKWEYLVEGSIGGGVSADFQWTAMAGAKYNFDNAWNGKIAYRLLDIEYESDTFVMDTRFEGLLIGIGYVFGER